MKTIDKRLLRMAAAIHRQATSAPQSSAIYLSDLMWPQIVRLHRRRERARRRNWRLAQAALERELGEASVSMRADLRTMERRLADDRMPSTFASVTEIYSDLSALSEEFEEFAFDRSDQLLSVTTEPIELEEVYLGPFEIRLDWSDLHSPERQPYRVVATDPHPSAAKESVTHPHVQDEQVCEGEGKHAIRAALQQGRLFDFFLVVANLLRTYNPGSPYVSLEDWDGVECRDCGAMVASDDRLICENCESAVCDDCYYRCVECERAFCAGCIRSCEACGEPTCFSCSVCCAGCERELCPSCLEDNERCSACHEEESKRKNEEEVAGESARVSNANAPVQSDRLGEAAVPA